jgi:hypothetical protein
LGSKFISPSLRASTYQMALADGARVASPTGAAGEGPHRTMVMAQPTTANLDTGALKLPIQDTYPLDRATEALHALGTTHTKASSPSASLTHNPSGRPRPPPRAATNDAQRSTAKLPTHPASGFAWERRQPPTVASAQFHAAEGQRQRRSDFRSGGEAVARRVVVGVGDANLASRRVRGGST